MGFAPGPLSMVVSLEATMPDCGLANFVQWLTFACRAKSGAMAASN